MEQKTNEKVLAMYSAVCSLIDEGVDVEKIKVADVTKRAGIGKGTAYEYFRSKEELLSRALHYDFHMKLQKFHKELEKSHSFQDAVMRGFDWMEENACNNCMKVQFMKLAEIEKVRLMNMDYLKDSMVMEMFNGLLQSMIQLGKSERIISDSIPDDLLKLDLFSRFIEYFVFMKMRTSMKEYSIDATRKFLIEGMMRQYDA